MRAQKIVRRAKQTGLLKGCFLGRLALAASRHLGKFLDVAVIFLRTFAMSTRKHLW